MPKCVNIIKFSCVERWVFYCIAYYALFGFYGQVFLNTIAYKFYDKVFIACDMSLGFI